MNKVLLALTDLINDSFISKIFQKLKSVYYNSFIYSIFTKEEEEISLKFTFRLIESSGTVESLIIFISIFGIFLSLTISDLIIKISILIFIYFILYFAIFDKETLKNSLIYKIISRSIYE